MILHKNLENKNAELIEFMLFKNCDFIVGSTSGIHAYALLFDKPFFSLIISQQVETLILKIVFSLTKNTKN